MAFTAKYVNNLQQELQNGVDKSALKQEIINEDNTRHAFIVSKAKLSSQQYGAALESHLKTKFGWSKQTDNISGDATTPKGTKVEIKCSIEDAKGGFNYVQIRPSHTVDYYLLANYSITLDKVILLMCPKDAFIKIVEDHAQLAHGTKDATLAYREYAYRPKPLGREGTKGRNQWEALLQWQTEEENLFLA
jgi:hypothetical protein